MIVRLQRFATAGLASTLLYAVLAMVFERGGLAPVKASVTAYAVAAGFSYLAQRHAFASTRAHAEAVPRFLASTLLGLATATSISAGASAFGLAPAIGYAAVCLVVPVLNFVLLDRIVFRPGP